MSATETPTDTGAALYAAIVREPDEDTPRLAYADYLADLDPKRAPCPKCKTFEGEGLNIGGEWFCAGHRIVRDTSAADRAEFVRVQCELARELVNPAKSVTPHIESLLRSGYTEDMPCIRDKWRHFERLQARETALLALHPEWSQLRCPTCGGKGARIVHGLCPTCGGTGDLLRAFFSQLTETARLEHVRPFEFRRGFLDSVTLTLAELLTGEGQVTTASPHTTTHPTHYRASDLAVALVRALPLSRLPVAGLEPTDDRRFMWFDAGADEGLMRPEISALPTVLFDELPGEPGIDWGDIYKGFPTREAALDALALAACRIARRAAGLPVCVPG